MNLAEMIQFVKSKGRINQSDLDEVIKLDINTAYSQLCRKREFVELRVDNEELETVAGQRLYTAPYPIVSIVRDSVRYDVTDSSPGSIIRIVEGTETMHYRASSASTAAPQSVGLTSGSGSALYSEGTASVTNRDVTVSVSVGTWNSDFAGEWITFGADSASNNGGDYGYLIESATASTITLATPYRGPSLTGAAYSIRPGSGRRIAFDPTFTEGGKSVVYSWQRKPARLYNDEDVPEVDRLCEAVCWKALAENGEYHSDTKKYQLFKEEARRALVDALGQ
jgi:hypothetical protein